MPRIFVSYRREDAEGEAGRLFDDLVSRFGEDSVFLDVAAIEVGRDFRKAIDESVATCGVLLAVIGKGWVDAKNEGGQRRLDDPSDFVRLETASALKRDIPVIPVLVHGAKMPRAEELPEDLRELAYRNGVELTHARWRSDLDLLIKALHRYVEAPKNTGVQANEAVQPGAAVQPVATPTPAPDKTPPGIDTSPAPWWKSRVAILTLVLAVAVALAYWLWPKQPTVPDLTGATLSDATAKLEGASLAVGNKTYQEDAAKPPDTVLSQSPPPNSRVKSGTAVDIDLVKKQASVEVPRLIGKSLDAALTALRDRHLTVGNVSRESRSDKAQDTVLDEFPEPAKMVEPGTAIDLVVAQVSGNPTPGSPQRVRVPNLLGMSLDQARTQLTSSGLVLGSATPQSKAGVDPGIVLSQDPTPGQQVLPSTRVDLIESQQPNVGSSLPNFAGTWLLTEYTFNGVSNSVTKRVSEIITQNGPVVHIGRDYRINSAGAVTYQEFFAGGRELSTRDQADMVEITTWRVTGSVLIQEVTSDYIREYVNHPPGKEVRVYKFTRVAP